MHILFATLGYKPAYRLGGPIFSVSAKAERLVQRGHRVTVFATNSNLGEPLDVPVDCPVPVEGVDVWYFRQESILKKYLRWVDYFSKSVGFLYSARMKGELRAILPSVDLVHTHLPFVYPTYAAAKAAVSFQKPLFYHQRGVLDPARLRFRSLKKRIYLAAVEKPIMRSATTLFALTQAEAESYRALGVDTPIRILPNGIDVTQYRQSSDRMFCEKWKLPAESIVVLFLGRLHPIKGANLLVEAFLRIEKRFPHCVLVMAGPDEWGMVEGLRRRAADSGCEKRVVFTGLMEGEEKLNLLARADLFCLPSLAEGFSMAVLEAMASKTAVLLSEGCYFPEVAAAGAGKISAQTVEALSEALGNLLGSKEALGKMGESAFELVRSRYSWDRIVDDLLDAYKEGIDRNGVRFPGNGGDGSAQSR